MTKIYNDACDKNVAAVVVYKNDEGKLYYDSAKTKAVPAADCLNLFQKGVLLLDSGSYYAAASCTTAGVITFNS